MGLGVRMKEENQPPIPDMSPTALRGVREERHRRPLLADLTPVLKSERTEDSSSVSCADLCSSFPFTWHDYTSCTSLCVCVGGVLVGVSVGGFVLCSCWSRLAALCFLTPTRPSLTSVS